MRHTSAPSSLTPKNDRGENIAATVAVTWVCGHRYEGVAPAPEACACGETEIAYASGRAPSAATTTLEGEWTRWDYPHGETIWQHECPDCDRGLLLAPARFCGRCGGSGYLTTEADPNG